MVLLLGVSNEQTEINFPLTLFPLVNIRIPDYGGSSFKLHVSISVKLLQTSAQSHLCCSKN